MFLTRDLGEAAEELRIGLGHPDVDLASARKPDAERKVVGDAEREQPGLAAGEHLTGYLDDLTLDAAAGDGACKLSAFGDGELRADGPWGGAARCHDGGNRDAIPGRTPAIELLEYLPHGEIVARAVSVERLVPAATDRLAELGALELEAATRAHRRGDLGPLEQRPHQHGPQHHVRDEELRIMPPVSARAAPGFSHNLIEFATGRRRVEWGRGLVDDRPADRHRRGGTRR